ncbi:hypothetical protein BX666DRAFT_1877398 [Dichotomocladium elegans]|nr:hypothetical protein BX666DRAFT_1877398 [Dichotomocladium elegans]
MLSLRACSILALLGTALICAQAEEQEAAPWLNDMFYHHHPNKAHVYAQADGDRQSSPIKGAAAAGTPLRKGDQDQDDGGVFPNDMYYHHHPNKAFAQDNSGGFNPRLAAETGWD